MLHLMWCRLWLLLLSTILSDADALPATTLISNNPTPLVHPRTIMSASSLKGDDDGVLEEVMEPVKFEPSSPSSKQQQQAQAIRRRRRGRPGIVVFSGGTAFNAAAAEMASRNVVSATTFAESSGHGLDDSVISNISQSNSVDEMMMTSMMTSLPNNNNNNIEAGGGIKVWHVLPVTDDGGSTAEIVRVLGGPAVGDIRSRLLRLAPGNTRESVAVRRLLGHRLVSASTSDEEEGDMADKVSRMAREEWLDIIDGGLESNHRYNGLRNHANDDEDNDEEGASSDYEHPLWKGVSTPYRSIIRAFLLHFHTQVMQTHNGIRHSSSHPPFDFTGGSVGNFFFAGARTFFGSLPAAIFLFSKVAGIPSGSRVLPAILSEERLVLGAVLKDGTRLRGQYEISHPSQRHLATKSSSKAGTRRDRSDSFKAVVKSFDTSVSLQSLHPSEMSRVCYLLNDPTWRRKGTESFPNNVYPNSPTRSKNRIRRDWTDRHEVDPDPNPLVLEAISNANCVVYGCGSLFTSVLPSLVLRGVGEEIKKRTVPKVLLLNGWHDHETTFMETSSAGDVAVKSMDATSIVQAVVHAFDRGGISAGVYSKSQFSWDDSDEKLSNDDENSIDDGRALEPIPLITDYVTHIFYPIGTEIEIDEQSLDELCASRRDSASAGIADHLNNKFIEANRDHISVIGIPSIPADQCVEGKRSGGRNDHRIFDAGQLVDALLDLAST